MAGRHPRTSESFNGAPNSGAKRAEDLGHEPHNQAVECSILPNGTSTSFSVMEIITPSLLKYLKGFIDHICIVLTGVGAVNIQYACIM